MHTVINRPDFGPPILLSVVLFCFACGDENSFQIPPEVQVAELSTNELIPDRSIPVPTPATVIGVDSEAQPLIASATTLYTLMGETLEHHRLFSDLGDPVSLGTIHALRPSSSSRAWLAADAGLFAVDTQFVVSVAQIGRVIDAQEITQGAFQGLWLTTPGALLLSLPTELARFEVPDLDGGYQALAIAPNGQRALTLANDKVYVVEPNGPQLQLTSLSFDPGPVQAIAASTDALWIGSHRGLFALRSTSATLFEWMRIDGPSGALMPMNLDAQGRQMLVHTANNQLLSIELQTNEPPRGQVLISSNVDKMTADGRGGIWVVRNQQLEGYALSAAPRFERDIRPFIEDYCSPCHTDGGVTADFRIFDVFRPRATSALARIQSGDMPRCENNLPCPSDQRLQPAMYEVLERWINEGQLP